MKSPGTRNPTENVYSFGDVYNPSQYKLLLCGIKKIQHILNPKYL